MIYKKLSYQMVVKSNSPTTIKKNHEWIQ